MLSEPLQTGTSLFAYQAEARAGESGQVRACGDLPSLLALPPQTRGLEGSVLTCSKPRLAFLEKHLVSDLLV